MGRLEQEPAGQSYNKSAHRRQLRRRLPGRSEGAIEFKHANISAVMLELGDPYLHGYQLRNNLQRGVLVQVVQRQLARHRELDELALSAVERPALAAAPADFTRLLSDAPRAEIRRAGRVRPTCRQR